VQTIMSTAGVAETPPWNLWADDSDSFCCARFERYDVPSFFETTTTSNAWRQSSLSLSLRFALPFNWTEFYSVTTNCSHKSNARHKTTKLFWVVWTPRLGNNTTYYRKTSLHYISYIRAFITGEIIRAYRYVQPFDENVLTVPANIMLDSRVEELSVRPEGEMCSLKQL
jgi:hypothetical protein